MISDQKLFSLAKKYGSPLYVYDLDAMAKQVRGLSQAFDGKIDIHYAMKANSHPDVLKKIRKAGGQLDVVALGEILRATECGFKPREIIYSGVGKTSEELEWAITHKIKFINVESLPELKKIAEIAKRLQKSVDVSLRLNPNVDVNTHPYIRTGMRDNKFGIELKDLPDALVLIQQSRGKLNLVGVAVHIGSQILDLRPLKEALVKIGAVVRELQKIGCIYFDIGGGLGIDYLGGKGPSYSQYASVVRQSLKLVGLKDVKLVTEPGRCIVGPHGYLVTKVLYVKKASSQTFVIVDTGMNHLLRPALYQAFHRIEKIGGTKAAKMKKYTIVGPICESSDVLGKDRRLPEVFEDDYLVIKDTGAYGRSMASEYNLQPLPKEICV